jgi:hypothetical protein
LRRKTIFKWNAVHVLEMILQWRSVISAKSSTWSLNSEVWILWFNGLVYSGWGQQYMQLSSMVRCGSSLSNENWCQGFAKLADLPFRHFSDNMIVHIPMAWHDMISKHFSLLTIRILTDEFKICRFEHWDHQILTHYLIFICWATQNPWCTKNQK